MKDTSKDKINQLPGTVSTIFHSDRTINDFTKNSGLDKLLRMLTLLDKDWSITVGDEEEIAQTLFHIRSQYEFGEKRSDIVESMKRNSIYAVSSREDMVQLFMCAQNSQIDLYQLSDTAKTIAKRAETFHGEIKKAVNGYESFAKYTLAILNSVDEKASELSLNETELRILLSLYLKRNSLVDLKTINEDTELGHKKDYLKPAVKTLISKMLVVADTKPGEKLYGKPIKYMITASGIKKIMQYIENITKQI